METNQAATQLGQETAAQTTEESATSTVEETKTVEASPKVDDKDPEWYVKRIGEMTAKWRTDERRAQAAEQELQTLRQQLQQKPKEDYEPLKRLEDFGYDEGKYQSYLDERIEKRAEAAARRVRLEEQEQVTASRRARKFKEREVSFEKETPDYREVAHYAPINDDVAEIIQELDSGPELAYYLGKNKDIALHLNDLPPSIAAVELGRIDAKISAEKAAKAAALEAAQKAKAVTQAPPPPPKIEGSNAQVEKSPSEMTDKEFAKWRQKQIDQRRNS